MEFPYATTIYVNKEARELARTARTRMACCKASGGDSQEDHRAAVGAQQSSRPKRESLRRQVREGRAKARKRVEWRL